MPRKRKQNDQATATLQELPRDTEELTSEEAEAVQGGVGPVHQWKWSRWATAMMRRATESSSETPSRNREEALNRVRRLERRWSDAQETETDRASARHA
jgi:hypothetical protein